MISNWIYAITIWFGKLGYWGVFFSCLGLFPAEIVMAMVGAAKPDGLFQIALVSSLGEMLGALPTYLIGLFFSKKDILHFINGKGRFLNVKEGTYSSGYKSIQRKGIGYIFFTRFIPWVRVASALVAGYVKYNIIIFSLAVFAGTFLYAYAFAYLGSRIGFNWEEIKRIIDTFNTGMLLLTGLGIIGYVLMKRLKSKKK